MACGDSLHFIVRTYCGADGAEQRSPLEYLSRQHDKAEADQAVDDEVLQVVPPRPEHLLLVRVGQGAHQGRPQRRHDSHRSLLCDGGYVGHTHTLSHCHSVSSIPAEKATRLLEVERS